MYEILTTITLKPGMGNIDTVEVDYERGSFLLYLILNYQKCVFFIYILRDVEKSLK